MNTNANYDSEYANLYKVYVSTAKALLKVLDKSNGWAFHQAELAHKDASLKMSNYLNSKDGPITKYKKCVLCGTPLTSRT